MSNAHVAIPNTWALACLPQLGSIIGGGTPSTSDPRYWVGGSIPWVSPKDMKTFEMADAQDHITETALGEASTRLVPAGSVLLVIRSGILQHTLPVGIATRDVALNQDMKAIVLADGLVPRYIAYALKASESRVLHECCKTGTTVQSVEIPQLRRLQLPIAPSPEQARIADRIDELLTDLSAGVAALERVRKKLRRYRSAVLHAAVTGRLTAKWRRIHGPPAEPGDKLLARILTERRKQWEQRTLAKYAKDGRTPPKNWQARYVEPVGPTTDGPPELPEGWCWASVDQCTQLIQYGTSAKTYDDATGVPVLRMGNITSDGTVDYAALKYLPQDHKEFPELLLQAGDILFNRTNSAELVGKSAVFERTDGPYSCASYLIRVRTMEDCSPWWITWCIISPLGRQWVRTVLSHTAGQANVNGTKLSEYLIPLPPRDEQAIIIETVTEKLSQIDAMEAEVERGLARAGRLRQAILKAAFEGKMVPQDPNDEPASVLLDRIKTERATAAESRPPRRKRQRKMVSS